MPLTKSDFLTYLDAPMHLWAQQHDLETASGFSVYAQHLARQGYQVETLAKEFLQSFVEQKYGAAEVTFEETITAGEYQSRIDALVYDQTAEVYNLYEIKSSTSVHAEHKYDVTFQYLVGQESELQIRDIFLVHVNGEYVREGSIDIQEFFVVEDMRDIVTSYIERVREARVAALRVMRADAPKAIEICHKPADCPCPDLCHPDLVEYSIYDLVHGRRAKYDALKELGVETIAEIPADFELNDKQRLQVASAQRQEPVIDHQAIEQELGSLEYPLYFLDYETFGPAIPLFDGYRPYQHITFQYSLHVIREPRAAELEHYEFLYTEQGDPSGALSEHLLSHIGEQGSVLVWNKYFEQARNDELAALQPQYAERFADINRRIYDLMEIFSKGLYVDYRFHGSSSIKKVLPVLVPELSYAGLNIGEGATAMTKWHEMVYGGGEGGAGGDAEADADSASGGGEAAGKEGVLSAQEREQIAEDLLAYCELDTLAMVEVWGEILQL